MYNNETVSRIQPQLHLWTIWRKHDFNFKYFLKVKKL